MPLEDSSGSRLFAAAIHDEKESKEWEKKNRVADEVNGINENFTHKIVIGYSLEKCRVQVTLEYPEKLRLMSIKAYSYPTKYAPRQWLCC
ncbi:hypothetical protein WISP_136207 [Willisornis vidua]|uniref:Uncharacterized protein n=1 Tax=Willisornis vidua TaxID=1566151 RepID=A0ABQ9CSX4_9PASS|nr:hypothetical protein WISP_136207 [Willisornis vidua]